MDAKLFGSGDPRDSLHRHLGPHQLLRKAYDAAPLLPCPEIVAATRNIPDTHPYAKCYWCRPPTNLSVSEEAYLAFRHSSSLPTPNVTSLYAPSLRIPDSHLFPSGGTLPPPVARN
jgi:hypothetical protein